MDKDHLKKAADMLLHGATLLAQPCPYCTGVRVLQDGRAFCVSCGTKPEKKDHNPEQDTPDIEQQVLELTRQLGLTTDPDMRANLLNAISELSKKMTQKPT